MYMYYCDCAGYAQIGDEMDDFYKLAEDVAIGDVITHMGYRAIVSSVSHRRCDMVAVRFDEDCATIIFHRRDKVRVSHE